MEIIRTNVNETQVNIGTKINSILADNYDWANVVTTVNRTDYYVDSRNFLRVSDYTSASDFRIRAYSGENAGTEVTSISDNNNFSMYKVGTCIILAFKSSYNVNNAYSTTANFIIDSTDNSTNASIIHYAENDKCRIFSKVNYNANTVSYRTYNSESLRNGCAMAQFAPYVDNTSGETFDNLHNVLITPVNDAFIDLDGEKWFVSNGFALPCGTITYTYV